MPTNKAFLDLLEKSRVIHERKNADYAGNNNPFENFERSAQLMEWFNRHEDKAFIALIATKLARLATLLNSTKEPNNEPIDDSFLDLFTYVGLWASYHQTSKDRSPWLENRNPLFNQRLQAALDPEVFKTKP